MADLTIKEIEKQFGDLRQRVLAGQPVTDEEMLGIARYLAADRQSAAAKAQVKAQKKQIDLGALF